MNLRRRGLGGSVCSGQLIVSGNFSTPLSKKCALGYARIVQRAFEALCIRARTGHRELSGSGRVPNAAGQLRALAPEGQPRGGWLRSQFPTTRMGAPGQCLEISLLGPRIAYCRGCLSPDRNPPETSPGKMKQIETKSEIARLQELLTCSVGAFGPSLLKGNVLRHIPQPCTQCANACQGADGPIKRVSCPITIKNKLPHIVAR